MTGTYPVEENVPFTMKISVLGGAAPFRRLGSRLAILVLFAVVSVVGVNRAHALISKPPQTTRTWSGGGTDDNWNTSANWGGTIPNSSTTPSGGDFVVFAGSTRTTPNNTSANFNVGSITFASGASGFTLGGSSVILNGAVTNNSSTLQTINLPLNVGATRSFNAASGDLAIGGVISGAGGLTKIGSGSLTLSGTNTYTGATTVSAGTLTVTGSLANTTTAVNSGGTLAGTGSIAGATTVASGGILAPGNATGALTFSNGLTLSNGSSLNFTLGSSSSQILVSGGTLTGPASPAASRSISSTPAVSPPVHTP